MKKAQCLKIVAISLSGWLAGATVVLLPTQIQAQQLDGFSHSPLTEPAEGPLQIAQGTGTRISFAPGATSWKRSHYLTGVDDYTFEAAAGQPASIRVTSAGQHAVLGLVTPSGEPLASGQMSGATSWSGRLPESGTYRLQVVDQGRPGWYTLTVSILPENGPTPPPAHRHVHNLGPIRFQPGATSATVKHYIVQGDTDRFTFAATAGQPASVYIGAIDNRVKLTLVSPSGQPLARYQSGQSSWSGRLPESGTYKLDAVADTGSAEYTLELNIRPR